MTNNIKIIFVLCISFCYIQCGYLDLKLKEGEKCTWKGVNGTCADIYHCAKAKYDVTINNEVPPLCTFNGRIPIICCTDCHINRDRDLRNEVFNPHLGTLRKTSSVAGNKFKEYLHKLDYPCKKERKAIERFRLVHTKNCYLRSERLTGGNDYYSLVPQDADLFHSVLLGYGEDHESAQWLCAGSIVSENFIITSANCTSNIKLGPVRHVVAGTINVTRLPTPWRHYSVKKIILHPEYHSDSKYHDIALIEIETPIVFSNEILPISLITDDEDIIGVFANSWNELGHEKELQETLESAYVNVLYLDDQSYEDRCSEQFPPQATLINGYNRTIQLCYSISGIDSEDGCQGDSGSSIQTADTTNCAFALVGITSIGVTCGEEARAGLFTRVKYYVPWIESIVWPAP